MIETKKIDPINISTKLCVIIITITKTNLLVINHNRYAT